MWKLIIPLLFSALFANPMRTNIPFIPRQEMFTVNVAKLIVFINANGYKCTFGETFRTKAEATANAKKGTGVRNSNHCYRMAIDLNIFKDGEYLKETKDYKFAGVYWESLNKYNEWGGRWTKNRYGKPCSDGNHFEMD